MGKQVHTFSNTSKTMRKTKFYLSIIFMCLSLSACSQSCKTNDPNVTNSSSGNDNTYVERFLPEWLVIDTSFINDCKTYYSKNLPMDTTTEFNAFPFVVEDSIGQKGLFVLVSLKRYDLLFINQFVILDEEDFCINASYVANLKLTKNFEALLFMIEPIDRDNLINAKGNAKFVSWGLYGSTQQMLDSVQTQNLIYLAKLSIQ